MKLKKFYNVYVRIHHPDSTIGFLSILTCPHPHPSIHLVFWCISKKVAYISKRLPKYFNVLYINFMHLLHQYLNCDYLWWMAYVFKMAVQKQGLEIKLLQRNRNPIKRLACRRAPESQLTAEQASTGRHWNSPKKIPHIQRQRRSRNETVGGAQSQ